MLGFWQSSMVVPPLGSQHTPLGGTTEVCFNVDDEDGLMKTFDDWTSKGVTIAQEPVDMPFGKTFLAVDPDGHRIRVAHPTQM